MCPFDVFIAALSPVKKQFTFNFSMSDISLNDSFSLLSMKGLMHLRSSVSNWVAEAFFGKSVLWARAWSIACSLVRSSVLLAITIDFLQYWTIMLLIIVPRVMGLLIKAEILSIPRFICCYIRCHMSPRHKSTIWSRCKHMSLCWAQWDVIPRWWHGCVWQSSSYLAGNLWQVRKGNRV